MLTEKQLADFAELSIKIGVNLQEGQELVIRSPIECADIARMLAVAGYKAGAKWVAIEYRDEKFACITYDYAAVETLEDIPDWRVKQCNYVTERKCALISIAADDPDIFTGVSPEKLSRAAKALSLAIKDFYDKLMANYTRWLVISVPTKAWADKVFPDCDDSVDKLWDAIAHTMRLDKENPVAEWAEHIQKLNRRAEFLNDHNFDYLHLTASNGTDIKVGLCENHQWVAAQELAQDGVPFTANLPTEEVFTSPHNRKINGTVHNALPLVDNSNVIDDFYITFKDGVVVDYDAKKGYDALKKIIETDEGSHSLGEIALIGKRSPIAESGLLFYNTLFDENASCHLALGKAYPSNVKGGVDMTQSELTALGHNDSLEHCDFMIGTPDMNIVGVDKNGVATQIFTDGEWCI